MNTALVFYKLQTAMDGCVYDLPRGVSLFRLIDLSFNRGARGKKMTASSARARLGGSRHLQLQSVSMAREGK